MTPIRWLLHHSWDRAEIAERITASRSPVEMAMNYARVMDWTYRKLQRDERGLRGL